MTNPIRIAIIGLSANATTDWASRAHLPYLLSPKGRAKFKIIALCNSSVEAARKSIEIFGLDPSTRAYGSAEDLARDGHVQLVVCSTRVDKHFGTVMSSLRGGKDVLVEWPLAENVERAREMVRALKEGGGKGVVGLQGWYTPTTLKLKELITTGRIGKILSSEVRAAGWIVGNGNGNTVPEGLEYFTDRKVGGNFVTIGFGHVWDWVQHVLGEVQNIQSRLQIQRPEVKVLGGGSRIIQSDVPDLISLTGTLPASENIVQNATFSMRFRRARPFRGEPALVWSIFGETGEIRLTSAVDNMLQASRLEDVTIEVNDFSTAKVQRVEFGWDEELMELPHLARSYASLYEAYAGGEVRRYADFDHAVRRHGQLDRILRQWDMDNNPGKAWQ